MKILFVASRFPYPPIQGDRVRSYHFLRLLSRQHSITLTTAVSGPIDSRAKQVVTQLCERWLPVRVSKWQAITNLTRFPFSAIPLQTLYFCPPVIKRCIQILTKKEAFDLVHVQLARMAPAVNGLTGLARVMEFIDAISLNMYRRSSRERWPMNWLFNLESRRMAIYEQKLVSSFDRQIVSSPSDREAIGNYETLHIVPNGVNIEDFPYNKDGGASNIIIFTGRMGYFPNADAAVYFATKVLPLIQRREPNVRFVIVGADPPRRVRMLSRISGVEVTGYVPNIQDYMARATVAVAPLQAATGIQNKVLEAMASGIPIVATPNALEGIDAVNGEHLLVAEDANLLAEKVLQLLKDPILRRRLARNARQLVEEKYTWERSVEILEKVYRMAIYRSSERKKRVLHPG